MLESQLEHGASGSCGPEPSAEDKERLAQAAAAAAAAQQSGSKLLGSSKIVPEVLRLVFPTLQKNESVFTILPTYVSVLGKKIDAAQVQEEPTILEWSCAFRSAFGHLITSGPHRTSA